MRKIKNLCNKIVFLLLIIILLSVATYTYIHFIIPLLDRQIVVHTTNQSVEIQTLFLGEYESFVTDLQLINKSDSKVILHIKSKNNNARLLTLKFNIGKNRISKYTEFIDYKIIIPNTKDFFYINKNELYSLTVTWETLTKTKTFIIK